MTIDAEKLADAVAYYDNDCRPAAPQFYEILSAARAHLATLPKWKEVEVERWHAVDPQTLNTIAWTGIEDQAKEWAKDRCVVRLTGTAKVRA